MSNFIVTGPEDVLQAVNYLLSNLSTGNTAAGNVTIPGNVLVGNTTTGIISQVSSPTTPYSYIYQFINIRYATAADGSTGFSTSPTNATYFGVYNSASSTPSSNPAAYSWYGVSGGFGTTKFLFYQTTGGRQIDFIVATSSPSPTYAQTVDGVAIDLNLVSSSAGTPGPRGAIAMAYVVTPSNPNLATSVTLTTWFQSPRTNTVAPIGTGLTPVTGDTANFIYAAGIGQPNGTYTYNGSTWDLVVGEVIAGNLIVGGTISGNTIAANTITATNIQSGTLTTNLFTANTISGNIISAGTITADKLAANAITANTVVSTGATLGDFNSGGFWLDGPSGTARFGNAISIGNNLIVGNNTIVGANLSVGTNATIGNNLSVGNNVSIGTNLIVGTNATIGGVITLGTLNANTVGTTQITPGSITTNKFTANTINGNIISAGTITADKLAANAITANTVVSTGATLGNFASPGFWLDGPTGTARFGNTLSVGNNLTIGNNATIGGNLTVSGLTTLGVLNANTVATTQVVIGAISAGISNARTSNTTIASNASLTTYYPLTGIATIDVPVANSSVYVFWDASVLTQWSGTGTVYLYYRLYRSVGGAPFQPVITQLTGPFDPFITRTQPGFSYFDGNLTTFGPNVTNRYYAAVLVGQGNGNPTFVNVSSDFNSIIVQSLKR
jgi:acyl-[acyl carrier protein]--UDP-N-acetylglucosamine O-acyltransferase